MHEINSHDDKNEKETFDFNCNKVTLNKYIYLLLNSRPNLIYHHCSFLLPGIWNQNKKIHFLYISGEFHFKVVC